MVTLRQHRLAEAAALQVMRASDVPIEGPPDQRQGFWSTPYSATSILLMTPAPAAGTVIQQVQTSRRWTNGLLVRGNQGRVLVITGIIIHSSTSVDLRVQHNGRTTESFQVNPNRPRNVQGNEMHFTPFHQCLLEQDTLNLQFKCDDLAHTARFTGAVVGYQYQTGGAGEPGSGGAGQRKVDR